MARRLEVRAQRATPELLASLEARGLIRRLELPAEARATKEGDHIVERLELGKEESGPWQMIAVGAHRTQLDRLTWHSDAESLLYFGDQPGAKPLLFIVATGSEAEVRAKIEAGTLTPEDVLAIELHPNDPATSFYTVPAGVLHDELTYPGPGVAPVFFVAEPSRMQHGRMALAGYETAIVPSRS